MPLFSRKGANVCCFSAVRAHVEQGDDAGAGMGADEDNYFNTHRVEILQEVSALKAGLMARKGDQ